MTKFFISNPEVAFYDDRVHVIPEGARELDDDLYNRVVRDTPAGKSVSIDSDGLPCLVDSAPIAFSEEVALYLAEVRKLREQILNRLAGISGRAVRRGNDALALECDGAVEQLLDITKDADVLAATSLDALKAAVLAAYRRITSNASPDVVNAFKGIDA
jgi:hypothetical protein